MRRSRKHPRRKRVGWASFYQHHGGWHLDYQEDAESVRKRVADTEEAAARLAAQVNAQLSSGVQTLFSFEAGTVHIQADGGAEPLGGHHGVATPQRDLGVTLLP